MQRGTSEHEKPLKLEPLAGPDHTRYTITPEKPVVIGRAVESDVCLLHEGVSRRHALLQFKHASKVGSSAGGRWYVTDLGSSPGTFVSGVKLSSQQPVALADGDLLRIGPWIFRVVLEGARSGMLGSGAMHRTLATMADDRGTAVAATLSDRRLNELIDATSKLMESADQASMARVVLEAAIAGAGYARGAVLGCPDASGNVEVLHSANWHDASVSRSLVREAMTGRVAVLEGKGGLPGVVTDRTVGELKIHSAICAPVAVGPTLAALLYLDARGGESRVQADASGCCAALARVYGMAIGGQMRHDLEQRRAALEQELAAAREAQTLIMPPPDGVLGRVRYSVRGIPGRFVAGDLFDVIDLGDERAVVVIGDVSGEGAGSAILMASTQAYLHAAIRRGVELERAMVEANEYVCQHAPMDRFVSAWVGLFDTRAMRLTFVDAGHGHWALRSVKDGVIRPGDSAPAGIPLGIDPDRPYAPAHVPLAPGDRVVLYSDGLVEQTSPSGAEFGIQRVHAEVAASPSARHDADGLLRLVQAHAQRPFLDDDTTIASVQIDS